MSRRCVVVAVVIALLATLLAAPTPATARPTYVLGGQVDDAPGYDAEVVTSPQGSATVAVWSNTTFGSRALLWSVRRPEGRWSTPASLDPGGPLLHDGTPAFDTALDRDGNIVVAWVRTMAGGRAVVTRTFRPDGRWSGLQLLAPASHLAQYLSLTVDHSGALTALWSRTDVPDGRLVTRTKPRGGGWASLREVPDSVSAQYSALATDKTGRQTVLWLQWDGLAPDDEDERVRSASRSAATVPWGAPAYLVPAGQYASQIAIAPAAGGLVALWHNYATSRVEARVKRPGAPWTAVTPVGDDPVGVYVDHDLAGRVTVVWERADAAESLVARRYVQGTWSPEQVVATDVDTFRSALDVSVVGRAAVQFRTTDDRVWTANSAGARFATPRLLGASPPGQSQAQGVEVDAQGNAVNLWNRDTGELLATAYDPAGPVTRISKLELRKFRRGRLVVRWNSVDRWGTVRTAQVRIRSTRPRGGYGPWRPFPSSFLVDPGGGIATVDKTRRYCVRVRAQDSSGTWGAWTARCMPRRR